MKFEVNLRKSKASKNKGPLLHSIMKDSVLCSYLATESMEYPIKNSGKTRNHGAETIGKVVGGGDTVPKAAEEIRSRRVPDGRRHGLEIRPSSLLNKTVAD